MNLPRGLTLLFHRAALHITRRVFLGSCVAPQWVRSATLLLRTTIAVCAFNKLDSSFYKTHLNMYIFKIKNRKHCCLCLKRNTRYKAYGISNFALSNDLLKVFIVVSFAYKMHSLIKRWLSHRSILPTRASVRYLEPLVNRLLLLYASFILISKLINVGTNRRQLLTVKFFTRHNQLAKRVCG